MAKMDINRNKPLEFGLYSLGDHIINPLDGKRISQEQRIKELIELAKYAEQADFDVFGVGESHQEFFTTQAHTVVLGAIAQATNKIKVSSSSSIVSTTDPVRLYEDFATIDLISGGRAEIIGGRASRVGLFELLGYDVRDYEELYEEKFELLLELNKNNKITWDGKYRAALNNIDILPQPIDDELPIWRAVGGPPASAIKAGRQGVPMNITTLGGPAASFKYSIDIYRETAREHGFDTSKETLPVATSSLLFAADTTQEALAGMYPHLNVGMSFIRGQGYPKGQFAQAPDYREALMVGSANEIIEKILYQHELYDHQRFMGQIDFGGVPYEKLMKVVDIMGEKVIPEVTKHLGGK